MPRNPANSTWPKSLEHQAHEGRELEIETDQADDFDDVRVPIHFSDVLDVDEQVVDDHGAFNVALVNDLSLFNQLADGPLRAG